MKNLAMGCCSALVFFSGAIASAANLITVVGNGRVEAMPDKVTIEMAVITKATVAKDAQASNAFEAKRLGDSVKSTFNLAAKDIKTTSYSVSPEYREKPDHSRELIGYTVRHAIAVTLNTIDRAGELIDVAMSSGANEISYIQFGLIDEQAFKNQALQLAMKDASSKARAIAETTGRPLQRVTSVSEGRFQIYNDRVEAAADAASAKTEIYPEAIVITADLTVGFEF